MTKLLDPIIGGGQTDFFPFRRYLNAVAIELGVKPSLDLGGMSESGDQAIVDLLVRVQIVRLTGLHTPLHAPDPSEFIRDDFLEVILSHKRIAVGLLLGTVAC